MAQKAPQFIFPCFFFYDKSEAQPGAAAPPGVVTAQHHANEVLHDVVMSLPGSEEGGSGFAMWLPPSCSFSSCSPAYFWLLLSHCKSRAQHFVWRFAETQQKPRVSQEAAAKLCSPTSGAQGMCPPCHTLHMSLQQQVLAKCWPIIKATDFLGTVLSSR